MSATKKNAPNFTGILPKSGKVSSLSDVTAMSPNDMIQYAQSLMVVAQQKEIEAQRRLELQGIEAEKKAKKQLEIEEKDCEKLKRKFALLMDMRPTSTDEIENIQAERDLTAAALEQSQNEIKRLMALLGIETEPETSTTKEKPLEVWQMVFAGLKIALLLPLSFYLVLWAADYITVKYGSNGADSQQVNVYNEISFQKILFCISVFFTSIIAVITALSLFVPTVARYMNPFSNLPNTFKSEFQNITPWQRNIISVVFIGLFLLALAMMVSGKID
jgi:hypothetical protein